MIRVSEVTDIALKRLDNGSLKVPGQWLGKLSICNSLGLIDQTVLANFAVEVVPNDFSEWNEVLYKRQCLLDLYINAAIDAYYSKSGMYPARVGNYLNSLKEIKPCRKITQS